MPITVTSKSRPVSKSKSLWVSSMKEKNVESLHVKGSTLVFNDIKTYIPEDFDSLQESSDFIYYHNEDREKFILFAEFILNCKKNIEFTNVVIIDDLSDEYVNLLASLFFDIIFYFVGNYYVGKYIKNVDVNVRFEKPEDDYILISRTDTYTKKGELSAMLDYKPGMKGRVILPIWRKNPKIELNTGSEKNTTISKEQLNFYNTKVRFFVDSNIKKTTSEIDSCYCCSRELRVLSDILYLYTALIENDNLISIEKNDDEFLVEEFEKIDTEIKFLKGKGIIIQIIEYLNSLEDYIKL